MKAILYNKVYLIFFLILLVGCATEIKISGSYSNGKHPYIFTMRDDSTFSYRYKFEFAYNYSDGYWSKNGSREVALRSKLQNRTLSLKVHEYDNIKNRNLVSVSIDIPETEKKYYQCLVFINDSLFLKRNCDSLSSIVVSKPMSSIFFKVTADERIPTRFLDTLITEKYFLKSGNEKALKADILYQDSLFNYKVFSGEVLRIRRNGLKFYSSKDNRWIYLPRVK